MIFSCCDENRKAAIVGNASASGVNGIDYLEVLDRQSPVADLRQRTLLVYCLKTAPTTLTPNNVLITGGESVVGISVDWIASANPVPAQITAPEMAYFSALAARPGADQILLVRTAEYGDFSTYTLRLVNDASAAREESFDLTESLTGFAPQLAEIEFSFKVECGPDFDCAPAAPDCPPELPTPPSINYLAKDYTSFRQVMLDRLNQLLPAWNATSEADVGIMLAELVAYAGDQLSYRQDAVTTEAYLMTARSRISLRRHALLVDYRVHDGCNARVWMQMSLSSAAGTAVFLDRTLTRFYTQAPDMPTTLEVGSNTEDAALIAGVVVFEPMQDANLFSEHNRMQLYTWGDGNCCLPQGAIEATLKGTFANLQAGDVLIFEEVMGPQTGFAADADSRHRCAVRLTAVTTQDASGHVLVDPLFDTSGVPITTVTQTPQPVTEIQWSSEDALPLPVCVSSKYLDASGAVHALNDVSVVLGNVVLADHGLTMPEASLGSVPGPTIFIPSNAAADCCHPTGRTGLPVRFRPQVPESPVTQAVALPLAGSPATTTIVALKTAAPVSLSDGNGFTTLMISANAPLTWPQYFGVTAQVNSGNPAEIDVEVVYAPPGMSAVVLERFTAMSFHPTDATYILTVLQGSKLVQVPGGFTPPSSGPAATASAPTMLTNTGAVDLQDGGSTYLELEATNPLTWPPLFGVVAQGRLDDPEIFNLLLVYAPGSGGVGVTLPVIVEQFNSLSLATIGTVISSASELITVKSFEEDPNPSLSATALMNFDASEAVPSIELTGTLDGTDVAWTVAPDLLGDGPDDTQFVMEVDTDGSAHLRMADGTNGKMPETGTAFRAVYRIGNGTQGNVGANSLQRIAAGPLADSMIAACTNPMPAAGGIDPETNAQIARRAPQAFLTQERAITMQDYVNVMEQNPQIEDAAAVPRWTGSWYTVFITAEPMGNAPLTKPLLRSLYRKANEYRLAGQDVYIEPPQYVSLTIELAVCVDAGYFRLDVEKALLQVLGSGTLPNGEAAFFAPQNFVLGQAVYLSPLYRAARSVAGVQTVTATTFQPQGEATDAYLHQGYIPMNGFQVARMDNDRSLPSHGQLTMTMQGGR